MPFSLYRGEILYWTEQDLLDPEEFGAPKLLTRKRVEKRIKEIRARLDLLLQEKVVDPLAEKPWVEDNGWRVYLTPAQRLRRGREQDHCLGSARGGPGEPYISVSHGDTDYGFWICSDGQIQFDQVQGYRNSVPLEINVHEAAKVAQKWAPQASWEEESDLDWEIRFLQDQLRQYRRSEFVLARLSGRLEPRVEIGDFSRPPVWRMELDPWIHSPELIRGVLLECREESVAVTRRRVTEYDYRRRRHCRRTVYDLTFEGSEPPEVGIAIDWWWQE